MVKRPSELFDVAPPNAPPTQPVSKNGGTPKNWAFAFQVLCINALVIVLGLAVARRLPDRGDGRQDDQHQQDERHDKKHDEKQTPDLKKSALVVIRNKAAINEDIGYTVTMQDREFWDWANANLADVEILEDTDDIAKQMLQVVNGKPPLVILFNTQTRKVTWEMPLPKDGTGVIKERLK